MFKFVVGNTLFAPAPRNTGQCARNVFRQAQRLADFANRPLGAIARHYGSKSRTGAPVGFVNPLDDFFAPLVLKIDIDIGRLPAFFRDEALEQQALPDWIDGSHTEYVADGGIGGGAAPLTENAFRSRKAYDRLHGQEVRRVFHALDKIQFMTQLHRDIIRQAVRVTLRGTFPCQLLQPLLRG